MKNQSLLIRLFAVVTAMMCALGASAAEAYACYTSSNTTLTFYYDNYRSSRTGTTYDLNTGENDTGWETDGTNANVTKVVFDPSFAGARPTTTYAWFYNMKNLQSITGMSYLNTSEVTNMCWMFGNCSKLTSLDVSHFNTSKVTTMWAMFYGCSGLTSLDLSSFNTSKVTTMETMFYDCICLTSLDVSHFNTSQVTDMVEMFYGCIGLTSLDVSSFNTSKVTNMSWMFSFCKYLRTIYVGNGWSTAAVTYSANMFKNCTSLVGGQGTTYSDSNPKDKTYAHIDGGMSNPGYFTAEGDEPWSNVPKAYACYTSSNTTLTFYYDTQRSSRPGTTYDLNTGSNDPGWYNDGTYANVTKVVFNSSFAGARPTTTNSWFYDMANLQSITGMSYLNTSEVTNMVWMFGNCTELTSLDLSSFNTSKVTEMGAMFYSCSSLTTLDLSSFNTSKVTRMPTMFNGCTNLRTVYVGNGWSTAAVTSSANMFSDCTRLVGGQGTTYNSSNPKDKTYAHIDGGTSNPGYFSEKPKEAYACYTLSNTTLTFYYDNQRTSRPGTTYSLNTGSNDPDWETDGTNANVTRVVFDPSFADASPTTTYNWFYGMSNLQSITGMSYLNTSEVTNMGWMFGNCTELTSLDVSHFNTSQVVSMKGMFQQCSSLTNLDLSSFITSKVTDMHDMFFYSSNLRTIYVGNGWSTAAVTYSDYMFYNCTKLVGGQGTTYSASNPKDKTYAHIDGGPSNPGYFTGYEAYACYTSSNTTLTFYYDTQRSSRPGTTYDLNTGSNDPGWYNDGTYANVTKVVFNSSFAGARPTTTNSWFYDMANLQSITGMSYLNTSEVTNMVWMFGNCTELTSLDLSSFNTSKVTEMGAMFYSCSSLTTLDLSSFNTSKVTRMPTMFNGCTNLRTVYVGNGWSTAAVTSSANMFSDCTRLVGGQGTTYNSSNPTDKTYAHIDGGTSNPGYFTAKNAFILGDVNGDGTVNIADVTALITKVLKGNTSAADCPAGDLNGDSTLNIADVTSLITKVLRGT